MFIPMCVASCFMATIILINILVEIFDYDNTMSVGSKQKKLVTGFVKLTIFSFILTSVILGFVFYNDQGDKRAIEAGAMRWESDKDGNLSRVWINQTLEKK